MQNFVELIMGYLAIIVPVVIIIFIIFFFKYKKSKNKDRTLIKILKNIPTEQDPIKLKEIVDNNQKQVDSKEIVCLIAVILTLLGIATIVCGQFFSLDNILKGVGLSFIAIGLGMSVAGCFSLK